MEFFTGLVMACVGVFFFLHAFTLIVVISRLVKLQLWTTVATIVARDEAGDELTVLDGARSMLEQAGFVYVDTRRVRTLNVSTAVPHKHSDHYHHADCDVHAHVALSGMPTARAPFEINLSNGFTDGRGLMTVNGTSLFLLAVAEGTTIAEAGGVSLELQLAHHLKERAQFTQPRLAPADIDAAGSAATRRMLPDMLARGEIYQRGEFNGEPVYGFRLLRAIRLAWQLRAALRARNTIEARRNKEDAPPLASAEVRHAADRLAFVENLSTLNDLRAPRWFRWSAFVVSAGAFIGLGSWWWGIATALVIAAVVAVHEAGHWLAMRVAGFRDVQVFFVPGMGAATSGEKHDASPLTHLMVFLAGPVPGLVLAMCGIGWLLTGQPDSGAWWFGPLTTAIGAAFLINIINLAPVMPLDGGRVIDLFVMGRLPWFRFGFALLSGALLLWAGINFGDPVMIGLGIMAALALSHQYRMAKVSRALLRQTRVAPLSAESFPAAAARLFDFLAGPDYTKWNIVTKVGVAQTILPRFLGRLPGVKETVLGMFVYIACIVAPLVMVIALAFREPAAFRALMPFGDVAVSAVGSASAPAPVRSLRELNDETLASTPAAQRIEVLGELVKTAYDYDDQEERLRLARMNYAENVALPAPLWRQAEAAVELVWALQAGNDKRQQNEGSALLKQTEQSLRAHLAKHDDGKAAMQLGSVLGAGEPANKPAAVIAIRQEIVDLYSKHPKETGNGLARQRTSLAEALDDAGRKSEAEEQLLLAGSELKRVSSPASYETETWALDYGWFLIDSDRAQLASQFITPFVEGSKKGEAGLYTFHRDARLLAAMAAREQGNWKEVRSVTLPIHLLKTRQRDGFLVRMFRPNKAPTQRFDLRAGLLLVEAERKLGNSAAADGLVSSMLKQYKAGPQGKLTCSINADYRQWRDRLNAAVRENEKREFACEEPPPPLSCPTPAVSPDALAD
jgi:Zn-dependent protease